MRDRRLYPAIWRIVCCCVSSSARCQVDFSVTGHRPDEATPLQPFCEQTQSIAVGPQYLYHVTPPAAEDKKVPAERVRSQRVLHFSCQPVETAAHIRHAGDQPDARASRKVNHASPSLSSLTSTRRSSGVSGPVRLRLPPGSVSQLKSRLSLMPCSRAICATHAPGCRVRSAMRILNSSGQLMPVRRKRVNILCTAEELMFSFSAISR